MTFKRLKNWRFPQNKSHFLPRFNINIIITIITNHLISGYLHTKYRYSKFSKRICWHGVLPRQHVSKVITYKNHVKALTQISNYMEPSLIMHLDQNKTLCRLYRMQVNTRHPTILVSLIASSQARTKGWQAALWRADVLLSWAKGKRRQTVR